MILSSYLCMTNQQKQQEKTIELLMAKNAINEKSLADKDAIISKYGEIIAKLTLDIEAIKFQNEQLLRLIYGSKRERFVPTIDSQQLTLEFEPKVVEVEEAVKAERELIRLEFERKKPSKEHQGRMALPSHLLVVETIIEPEEDTTNMVCIGKEITEELDYTPAKLHINRIIRPKYITKVDENGNQKQVIAELNRPIPKCIASPALLSMIYTDKFIFHLPLFRIIRRIAQMGVSVPSSTLGSWVKLGAQFIRHLYAVHRLHVFREIYQMIDESPIKVQDSEKSGTCHQGYMWVRYAPLSKSVLFEYYKNRSPLDPLEDLSDFKGYLQTDGYSGYTYLASKAGVTHLSCWAHAH